MPTTYPIKRVNGFLIAGGEAEDTNFTYPRELEKELKKRGWRNHPESFLDVDKHKVSRDIQKIIDVNFKITSVLADKYQPDFFQATCFHINNLHHFLWDSPETRHAWEIIDKHIGNFMKQGCDLIIMSDHGSNKIGQVFNINVWLEQEGYLRLKPNLAPVLYRLGITQERLLAIASRLRLLKLARKLVPGRLYREIPDASGEVGREAKTAKVDWHRSQAIASGQGPIYLNPENDNNERLRKELKRKLEALLDPSSGTKIIEKVYTREEIYRGRYLAEAPDLIMDQAKGVHIPGGIGQRGVFDSPQTWEAENKKFGLFMAYGPNIKRGGRINNVSILDLAPTILHLMNIPIADDMDGRVLREIFARDSEPARRKVKLMPAARDEAARVKQRLKALRKRTRI
jgi:predicted AlkP superfamily phosphohydrolase/phosphomutase